MSDVSLSVAVLLVHRPVLRHVHFWTWCDCFATKVLLPFAFGDATMIILISVLLPRQQRLIRPTSVLPGTLSSLDDVA